MADQLSLRHTVGPGHVLSSRPLWISQATSRPTSGTILGWNRSARSWRGKGGWATRSELVGATSRRAVGAAVERGDVQRIALGIYALPGLPVGTVAMLAYDGVLSHVSAAAGTGSFRYC